MDLKRWTALVPIRTDDPKSRLAGILDPDARIRLAARMARHVLATLAQCSAVARTVVLSDDRPASAEAGWAPDRGRGLNEEIAAFRREFGRGRLLVVHADLPLLEATDIAALLEAAENHGAALAMDRAGTGTNALALADGRAFDFHFGRESRARHCLQDPRMPVLNPIGLCCDLDTPEDFARLGARGCLAGLPCAPES